MADSKLNYKNRRTNFMKTKALILGLFLALALTGCQGQNKVNSSSDAAKSTVAPTAAVTGSAGTQEQKTFTLEELATYNGKNGMAAYVAVDGKVYDVSKVKSWMSGLHANKFEPGKDYSSEIKKSPHGSSKLNKLPVVGILKK